MSAKKKAPNRANDAGAILKDYREEQLSFLPPPPFSPKWPTSGTLPHCALSLFMDGKRLDHPDFYEMTQSWRLSAVVHELRELGWPIESVELPAPTKDRPHRFIALYHLAGKYIAQAKAILKGDAVCHS